ncbi:MAG: TonB-dependent receptor [Gammaproteobacteria bacterium PRO9]|nr:TonB-dependent receptor [Gammaproteobacteria bacterium PRO9]
MFRWLIPEGRVNGKVASSPRPHPYPALRDGVNRLLSDHQADTIRLTIDYQGYHGGQPKMQREFSRRCGVAATLAVTLVAFSVPVYAAEAIQEIVVTARKKQERLVDVPMAITAITSEAIEEKGIRSLDDVAANTPGLTFSNLQGELLPAPVIRGVAPIDIFGENNVGIYIDGVFVSGRAGLNFSQLDLERIEVIKGPQAALYGRNAFSGAINYVSRKPSDTFEADTEVSVGNDGQFRTAVSAGGPLIEGTLKGRLAVSYDKYDGSFNNDYIGLGRGVDVGGHEYKTGHAALAWTPTEDFTAELSLYMSRDLIDQTAQGAITANCEDRHDVNPALSSRLQNYCGEIPSPATDSVTAITQALGEDRKLTRGHLRLSWDTGVGTLSSLTGYSALSDSFLIDGGRGMGEEIPFTYLSGLVTAGPPFNHYAEKKVLYTGLLQIEAPSTTDEISEELRFTSPEDRAFRYSGGVYLYKTRFKGVTRGVLSTKPLPADFGSFCLACTYTGPVGQWIDFAQGAGDGAFLPWFTDQPWGGAGPEKTSVTDDKAYAVFASAEWDFLEGWTAGIEGRFTRTDKDYENRLNGDSGDDSWNTGDWRATLRYKPAENTTIYSSIGHAEKSGGFDVQTVEYQDDPGVDHIISATYDSEKNTTYELGLKSEMLDRRLRTDVSVFYIDWTDIVIPQGQESYDGRQLVTPIALKVNSGDASIKGVEFSLDAQVTDYFTANIGISYQDAQYDDANLDSYKLFPSFAPDGDVSGNKILWTSEWQGTIGAGYKAPLRGDVDWYLRGDAAYRGKQFQDAGNQAWVPASTTANAHLGITRDTWTVEIYAMNLFGNDKPTGAYRDVYFTNTIPDTLVSNGGAFFPWRYSITYPRLETYGVTWRMKF